MSNVTQLTLNLIGTFIAILTVSTGLLRSYVGPLQENLAQINTKLTSLELEQNKSNYDIYLRLQNLERNQSQQNK